MRRLLWPSILIIGISIAIAVYLTLASQSEDTLAQAQRLGVIRVGYAPESPFAFRDNAGNVTGESPEIIRHVLGQLGIHQIEWVQTEWASLIPNLNAGRFDIIASGMFITCERAQQIAFTQPTYQLNEALLVPRGNPRQLHSYDDILKRDAVLVVIQGAQEQNLAIEVGITDRHLLAVPDAQTGLAAVLSGRADALALTSVSLKAFASGNPQVELAAPFTPPMLQGVPVRGYGAFGVRTGDTPLRNALDAQLASFIGSQQHLTMVAPFGFTHEDLPASSSAHLLDQCAPSP
ncbi:ectoine/hydroxyectoine ABC transporter substrate-binding protein EhuB [Chloroflexia bacterium SDU3-3]|nr:ectoine/hydroxyectoine ABC transporter substrate-binding protein EhuB [Chloroflexia bacterium SDU3-3]